MRQRRVAAGDTPARVMIERQAQPIGEQRLQQRGVTLGQRHGGRVERLADDEVLEPGPADRNAGRIAHGA